MAQTNNNEMPVTFGEVALGGVLGVAMLSNPAGWAVPALMLLGQGVFCAVRRSPGFREWADEKLALSEDKDATFLRELYEGFLIRLPKPKLSEQLALPAPREEDRRLVVRKPTQASVNARPGKQGWGQAMMGVFGEDNPLDKASSKIGTSRRASTGETEPIKVTQGKQTRKLADEDDAWLSANSGTKPLGRLMTVRQLCEKLNPDAKVDEKPHVLIVGDSGAGKTLLAQLLVGTRPSELVILDPKPPRGWEGQKWGGLPYVGMAAGGSYKPLVDALRLVVAEMNERYQNLERMTEPPKQLTVVLDEAVDAVEASPELATLFKSIVRMGREARVRLVMLSTVDRVGALGFTGQGDLMNSLARINLGEFATDQLPELADQHDEKWFWAVFEERGKWVPFDTTRVVEFLGKMQLAKSRVWRKVLPACNRQVPEQKTTRPIETPRPAIAPRQAVAAAAEAPAGYDLLHELLTLAPKTMAAHPEVSSVMRTGTLGTGTSENTVSSDFGTSQVPVREPVQVSTEPSTTASTSTSLPMDLEAVSIRKLLTKVGSKNRVAAILGGSKTTAYARINRALGQ